MIRGFFGDEVLDHVPQETEVNCYQINPDGTAEYHSTDTLENYLQTDCLTDEYGFEVNHEG